MKQEQHISNRLLIIEPINFPVREESRPDAAEEDCAVFTMLEVHRLLLVSPEPSAFSQFLTLQWNLEVLRDWGNWFVISGAANDPRPQMIPRLEMIPKLDRK